VNHPVDWREENVRGDVKITKNTTLTLRYTQDSWVNALYTATKRVTLGTNRSHHSSDSWDQPGKVAIGN